MQKFILITIALICTNILFAQTTKRLTDPDTYLNSTGIKNLEFIPSDFSGSSIISSITVKVGFSSTDNGMFGFTFNEDIAFKLESPSGTSVNLVYDSRGALTGNSLQTATFNGFDVVNAVEIFFDDSASQTIQASPGGNPQTGNFIPEESLSNFINESGIGVWKLHISDSFDNGFDDKIEFDFFEIIITSTTLSVNEEKALKEIVIYPNPAFDKIKLQSNLLDITSVKFYNNNGALSKVVNGKVKEIDISNLSSGVYFIEIGNRREKLIRKIIKK